MARGSARGGGRWPVWLMTGLLIILPLLGAAGPASAGGGQTFVVNSTLDSDDGCAGECSLRDAINAANDSPGADEIRFNIGGSGSAAVIQPTSQLPTITDRVTIAGFSQGGTKNTLPLARDGSNASLRITLNGQLAGNATGLLLQAGAEGSVIEGLAIISFFFNGIFVRAANVTIIGCHVGTNSSGTADGGNGLDGVQINAPNVRIGGALPEQRNILSNNGAGISLGADGDKALIAGNIIGTNAAGTGDLGNSLGIRLRNGVRDVVIGGGNDNAGNLIAFNDGPGVVLELAGGNVGNRILRNAIRTNDGLGIDLGDDGTTANDAKDRDAGPNRQQNFPVLTSAVDSGGGKVTVKGSLASTRNTTFLVQVFASANTEAEGNIFVGQKKVTTDAKGKARFAIKTNAIVFLGGTVITATATNQATGDTSEFSASVTVT